MRGSWTYCTPLGLHCWTSCKPRAPDAHIYSVTSCSVPPFCCRQQCVAPELPACSLCRALHLSPTGEHFSAQLTAWAAVASLLLTGVLDSAHRRATVNTFGYIAKAIGPQDVLVTLLNNLKVQERQNRVCTTVAIAIVAETCAPFTVLPALMNEYKVRDAVGFDSRMLLLTGHAFGSYHMCAFRWAIRYLNLPSVSSLHGAADAGT